MSRSIISSRYRVAALALAAAAVTGLSLSSAEAKMPNIRRASEAVINFDLSPPPEDVGSTADGTATIEIKESRKSSSSELEVNVTGLADGTYSVVATLEQLDPTIPAETVTLGSFDVVTTPPPAPTETADATETEADEAEFEFSLSSGLYARNITQITISKTVTGAEADVVLVGTPVADTAYLKFFANVRVTAPPASALTTTPDPTEDPADDNGPGNGHGKGKGGSGKSKKVHGHALAKATVIDGTEKNRFFLFVAQGAPADTLLNIVVDGVKVGEVTSTKNGKVMFKSLSDDVAFESMDLLTITDANNVPVMQADFSAE